MSVSESDVMRALAGVSYPGFSRDIVSSGVVRGARVDGGRVEIELELGGAPPQVAEQLRGATTAALEALPGVASVRISAAGAAPQADSLRVVGSKPTPAPQPPPPRPALLPQVRHTVAIASGKGGVGKSTVAVNLAVALARRGVRVGLLDADVYGPSIPLMMGTRAPEPSYDPSTRQLRPFDRFGVHFMSLGFLVPADQAVIWRGPIVMKAIEQLLGDVAWGELDVLVVDMPPGTGDVALTLAQRVTLAGAVIVTTPQDVALADAIKGVAMFRKVNVPVLGVVENMSYFECPECRHRSEIFGHGGGRAEAERLEVPFLGEIPLDAEIRSGGDSGRPAAAEEPPSARTEAFLGLASAVLARLPREEEGGLFDRFQKIWNRDED
jgi:ATP-binding protein involved in chromosome partitioning